LSKASATRALAAFDPITRDCDIVRRCGPCQIDLRAGGGGGGESRRRGRYAGVRRTLGSCARRSRIATEVTGNIRCSDSEAVGGRGRQSGGAVRRRRRRADLREGRATRALAALDFVARDAHVVGRSGPTQIDLATGGRCCREPRGRCRRSRISSARCGGAGDSRVTAEISGGIGGADSKAIRGRGGQSGRAVGRCGRDGELPGSGGRANAAHRDEAETTCLDRVYFAS